MQDLLIWLIASPNFETTFDKADQVFVLDEGE